MMRRLLLAAGLSAALFAPAAAQQNGLPPIPLPANTIFGNPLPVPAYGQAIPTGALFLAIFPIAPSCPTNQWAIAMTASGFTCSQPAFSQISGSVGSGQLPSSATFGSVAFTGISSGTISVLPQAAAGTFNFNLPTTPGVSGTCLASGGGGSSPMTWTPCATGSGVPQNNLNMQSGNYTIQTTDCGATINETGALKTITLPSVSGFAANCVLSVYNASSSRGQILSGFPGAVAAAPTNILWPTDTITVEIVNGAWSIQSYVGRHKITASTTLYVDGTTSGASDSNDCLASGAAACKTIPGAIAYLQTWDGNAQAITISVADSTYTNAVVFNGPFHGNPTVTLQGDLATPANTLISTTGANAITVTNGATVSIGGFKITTATSGFGILVQNASFVTINGAMEYAATITAQLSAGSGGVITISANYTISGGAPFHYRSAGGGTINANSVTITTSGTPAFATAFASTINGGAVNAFGQTYSGTGATGTRYAVSQGGIIFTQQTSGTYFPGNAAGTIASGGRVDGVGTPGVSSCGTGSPSVTAGSTDFSGSLVEGSTATACTITFATASTMKACTVSLSSGTAIGISTLGATLVVAHASLSGNTLYWNCAN